jgi:hypothetical protein
VAQSPARGATRSPKGRAADSLLLDLDHTLNILQILQPEHTADTRLATSVNSCTEDRLFHFCACLSNIL